MTDLAFRLDETGSDLELELGDLKTDEGLVSAVLVSLWSDARARADDDIPDGGNDVRGYWGQETGDDFGSRLWLYDRSKMGSETENDVREAAESALRWLVAEEIASEVRVATSRGGTLHEIRLEVEIVRGASKIWASLWDAVEATVFDAPGVRVKLLTY